MPKVLVTDLSGNEIEVAGKCGSSLMRVIRDADIEGLEAMCGGMLSCATCHVYVDQRFIQRLQRMGEIESAMLDSLERRTAQSRLSCQIVIEEALDGLRVTIAGPE